MTADGSGPDWNPWDPSPTRVSVIHLHGHLTEAALVAALAPVQETLDSDAEQSTQALVVDSSMMTGYDAEARSAFIDWNRRYHGRLQKTAIVTDNQIWRIVVAAMALASGQSMKAFPDIDAAVVWARA